MADLTTNFAGIKSPNPFWLASAPPTNSGYQVMKAFEAGWGGAVWKTLGVPVVNVSSRYAGVNYRDSRLIGLSKSHLPKHAITYSGLWRTFKCIELLCQTANS